MFEKIKEGSITFMQAHPKFTKHVVAGTAALATIGSGSIVANADATDTTEAGTDVVDTVINTMSTQLGGVAAKVIPAAVGIGVVFVAVGVGWKYMKKFMKG